MWYRGNKTLWSCALHPDPLSVRGIRNYQPPNPVLSSKIFLSEATVPNTLKLIWGLLEHVWMLRFARHGDWSPVRGAPGAFPYFGDRHTTRLPVRFESNLVSGIRAIRHCQIVLPVWIRPLQRFGEQLTPKSGILLKMFLSETTGPNAQKLVWGLFDESTCLDVRFCLT